MFLLPEMITCPCLTNFSYLRFSLDLHSWAMLSCAKSRKKNMLVCQQYRDIDVYEAGNLIFPKKIVEVVRKIRVFVVLS